MKKNTKNEANFGCRFDLHLLATVYKLQFSTATTTNGTSAEFRRANSKTASTSETTIRIIKRGLIIRLIQLEISVFNGFHFYSNINQMYFKAHPKNKIIDKQPYFKRNYLSSRGKLDPEIIEQLKNETIFRLFDDRMRKFVKGISPQAINDIKEMFLTLSDNAVLWILFQ